MVANWRQFITAVSYSGFVLQMVNESSEDFPLTEIAEIKQKGMTITLSRCSWKVHGFILWVEFHIPLAANKMAEGTMELHLANNGSISHIQTLCNIALRVSDHIFLYKIIRHQLGERPRRLDL